MIKRKLKRWLNNWLDDRNIPAQEPPVATSPYDGLDYERTISFQIYFAQGGRVIQTRRYDRAKDRSHISLYIVTEDQDLGQEIDKIITMEALRS